MRVARDTNILAHAEGFGDVRQPNAAMAAMDAIEVGQVFSPAQLSSELFDVLARKAHLTVTRVIDRIAVWPENSTSSSTDPATVAGAMALARRPRNAGVCSARTRITASNGEA